MDDSDEIILARPVKHPRSPKINKDPEPPKSSQPVELPIFGCSAPVKPPRSTPFGSSDETKCAESSRIAGSSRPVERPIFPKINMDEIIGAVKPSRSPRPVRPPRSLKRKMDGSDDSDERPPPESSQPVGRPIFPKIKMDGIRVGAGRPVERPIFPKIPRSYADQNSGKRRIFDGLNSGLSKFSESQTQPYIYKVHNHLRQTQPYIYKVHNHLRNINDKAYEPQIVAIGPYHRGKDNLQMMEDHKFRYLESLLRRKDQNVGLYISAIEELEEPARRCYSEPISLDASQFIEMLVLDGCFIIEFIRKFSQEDRSCTNDPIFQMNWILGSLLRDLILFENQIPFFILCQLYDLIEAPDQHNMLIERILVFCQSLYPGSVPENRTNRDSGEIKHLLDLIHNNWRPSLISNDVQIKVDSVRIEREFRFIHSATELTDADVSFSKRKSDTLFDVDFVKGVLVMPPLVIDDRTECFFRNLIAYEEYFPDNRANFVTDYVRFMDCLINTSRDVEILSECGIIDNWLGENEVVAGIFNQLTDSVTGPGEGFMYSGIVDRVNRHYKRRWNRARAKLRRDYFYSRWAYIAFFSAVFLLLLTMAQTVFSVLQVV